MFPLCIIGFWAALVSYASAQVDLHAHLVMKPGMGPGLIGDFESPPQSMDWTSRIRTKASRSSLLHSNSPDLIVVSLYGHSWLSRWQFPGRESNVVEALEEEYRQIKQFAEAPGSIWTLARSAREARKALKHGKKVLILSIEGAYGAIRTSNDLERWVERGLAILTPFHLTEDRFGGVAFMKPWASVFNTPFSFLSTWMTHLGNCADGICRSPVGVSPLGIELIEELIQKQVWIDLSHAPDLTVERLIPIFRNRNLPILVTHTATRDGFPAERGLSPALINEIRSHTDGMVGLIPSQEMVRFEKTDADCRSGVSAYRREMEALKRELGEQRVAIGSDANAPLQGLSPPCDAPSSPGYAEYGHLAGLVGHDRRVIDHFLTLWEKIRPDPRGADPIEDAKSPRIRPGNRR
jgi:microsomal dipeptidase-like Zn-dependent dipeptidase